MDFEKLSDRELDVLVAERVLGLKPGTDFYLDYKRLTRQEQNIIARNQGWTPELLHPYSTDIAAAWEVVERAKSNFRLEARFSGSQMYWWAEVGFSVDSGSAEAVADTAARATCLAALKAVEEAI